MSKLILISLALALSAATPSGYDLFQKALVKERAEGNVEEAILLYQRIVKDFAADRPLAAKALLQMGQCFEKLGKAEARQAYARIVRDYAEEREVSEQARTRLAALDQGRGSAVVARQVWVGAGMAAGAASPDGRYVARTDILTGNLLLHDLTTGEQRSLSKNNTWSNEYALSTTFSPDSRQLAYAWFNQKDLRYELRIIRIAARGGVPQPRVVFRNEDVPYLEAAAWSADGANILAVLSRKDRVHQIVQISVADGSTRVLKTLDWRSPGKMDLSADGRFIAYDFPPDEKSPSRDIFLLATDGSSETRLVEHPAHDSVLGWTPDGSKLVFASDRTGTTDAWVIPVAAGRARGAPELVKKDIGQISPMGFTRKGVYYYTVRPASSDVLIAEVDPAAGQALSAPAPVVQRYVGTNTAPTWSPDGKYLAYVSRRDSPVLCIRAMESGEERDLPLNLKNLNWPLWSPDGRSILVSSRDEKNRYGLYRVNPQTGEASLVAQSEPGEFIQQAAWSPDAKAVYYRRSTKGYIRQELDTGQEKEWSQDRSIRDSAVSPDGRWLVFLSLPDSALKLMPAAGGEPRELLRVEKPEFIPGYSGLAWTPDSRHVLFVKARMAGNAYPKTELWRAAVDTGEARNLGLTVERLRNISLHPAGRRIAFDAGLPKAEIWALENLLPDLRAAK